MRRHQKVLSSRSDSILGSWNGPKRGWLALGRQKRRLWRVRDAVWMDVIVEAAGVGL